MNDPVKWLEENAFYCVLQNAKMTDEQCLLESAKATVLSSRPCEKCVRYVPPTEERKDKVTFGYNRMNFGSVKKRKSIPRTPPVKRTVS